MITIEFAISVPSAVPTARRVIILILKLAISINKKVDMSDVGITTEAIKVTLKFPKKTRRMMTVSPTPTAIFRSVPFVSLIILLVES